MSSVRKTTVRAFSLGIITGGFIAAGTIAAFPAKATPDSTLQQIAIQEEPYVCNTLELRPTVSTLLRVMEVVQSTESLGDQDTGTVVAMAIFDGCDQFVPVIKRFVAMYASGATA